RLVAEANDSQERDPAKIYVMLDGPARYDCQPQDSLAAHAQRRGVSSAEAFIELSLESEGKVLCYYPFLNQSLDAVQEMLAEPVVLLGSSDAGAHVGLILDSTQPTFCLTYW